MGNGKKIRPKSSGEQKREDRRRMKEKLEMMAFLSQVEKELKP